MGKAIRFIDGIPTTIDLTASVSHYDESIPVTTEIGVAGTGYDSTHKIFTLPNAQTYDSTTDELKTQINGIGQVEGVSFNYTVGAASTTITFVNAIPKNARVRFIIEGT